MGCLRTILLISCLLPMLVGGCHWRPLWLRKQVAELPPEAFAEKPTLEDVIFAINANTDRVEQLQTESATLKAEGVPALRANLAFQRPKNFRLRAELFQFTGRELDMGSNDELFWFWIRRDREPAVYYARHDQFASSPARNLIPIEPQLLIESFGLVHLDPQRHHEGPFAREGDRLEIRSRIPSAQGDMTRVLLADAKYGWIMEQHLYDADGQLLVSARADRYKFYPDDAVSLPHHIEIRLTPGQPAQLAFELDVSGYMINRLYGEPTQLWALPEIDGYPLVNIADPRFQPPRSETPSTASPHGGSVYGTPRSARVPTYRGYDIR